MTVAARTSEELLLRYAAGQLRPAPALVVASHLAMSASSRRILAEYESIGGGLLEREAMADLPADFFERTLVRLDAPALPELPASARDHQALGMGIALPVPLARRAIGPWKWLGPGMRFARVDMPEDADHNLVLLRVPAGRALPEHSHSGEETTLVLKGVFQDEAGRYGVGDLILEDEQTNHTPMVAEGGECICLAAIEGPMKIRSWIGRMIAPMIGL